MRCAVVPSDKSEFFDLSNVRCDAVVQIELSLPWPDVQAYLCVPCFVAQPLAFQEEPKVERLLTVRVF